METDETGNASPELPGLRRSLHYDHSEDHLPQVNNTIPRSPQSTLRYTRGPRDNANYLMYQRNEHPVPAPLEIYSSPYHGITRSPTSPLHNIHHEQWSESTQSREWPAPPPPVHQSPHHSPPLSRADSLFTSIAPHGPSNNTTPPLSPQISLHTSFHT
ncbi:hypothetical protein M413DRAFT_32723 [Hebeloma cylindrosporum]|uniref:Uncharacterized protein n=1 Tax=Hebeloma cylindrosporum TaxID=76867 RepID=A0A0C2Y277_HEBCY|nr:hypothetical protein M413DRAFT_32723 [Hebeloma cylindrosporum h7]